MSIFDDLFKNLLGRFSDWIKINDPKSKWTIEDFPYETGVDENITRPHCWNCVTVNQCWFVDKKEKRPQEFDYSQYSLKDIPLIKRGLYHPNCHDQKIKISTPNENNIKLIIPPGKIEWLFSNKLNWLLSMGYYENDRNLILSNIYNASKKSYSQGNYTVKYHDKYGFKITLNIDFPGGHEKFLKIYKLVSSYMIYPNGKLKNNTPIGGWKK